MVRSKMVYWTEFGGGDSYAYTMVLEMSMGIPYKIEMA